MKVGIYNTPENEAVKDLEIKLIITTLHTES